jgi:hypothetical protein
MPPPASKRKFLFLFCSRVGQTSQEAKYYQYVVVTNGDVRALPTQLGLIEAILGFLAAIVITVACRKLIIYCTKIYIQISQNTKLSLETIGTTRTSQSLPKSQQIWKSGRGQTPDDGLIELQKKRLNTLKALKRAQKCAPPMPHPPRFTYCSACDRQSDEVHVIPPERFG